MNLLSTMLSALNGGVGQQLGSQFGVETGQLGSVMTALAPVLAGGLKEKLTSGSAGGLLDILKGGNLQQYTEDPTAATSPAAAETGNNILGQLFGGGSMLTNIVSGVSEKSGVGSGIIQKMLPILTSLFMGFIAKQATAKDGQIDTGSLTNIVGSLTGEHHGMFDTLKAAAGKIFG